MGEAGRGYLQGRRVERLFVGRAQEAGAGTGNERKGLGQEGRLTGRMVRTAIYFGKDS